MVFGSLMGTAYKGSESKKDESQFEKLYDCVVCSILKRYKGRIPVYHNSSEEYSVYQLHLFCGTDIRWEWATSNSK